MGNKFVLKITFKLYVELEAREIISVHCHESGLY